jgi:type I restriction enzyme S subunit
MNEINLSEGWLHTKFTEVLDIQGGTQPPKSQFIHAPEEGYIRLLQIRDFGAKPVPTYIPDTSKLKKCEKSDLLIGRYGASLGRICSGMEGAYNVALAKVISGKYLHKAFLKGYLESELFQQPLALLSRSAQNGFNKDDLATFDFALPPIAEQKVIADKLDTLLAQVETTKARLDRIPDIIKRFRQSVLAAAVSGKLTEEWRGSRAVTFHQPPITIGEEYTEAPRGWSWTDLTELARLESGHTPRKSVNEYWEGGDVPWISLQDIREAHGTVIQKTKFMPTMKGIDNSSARLLPKGTVCFSRDISVGYTTIMGTEMATTQHFVNWICDDRLVNIYLMYSFMAAKDHLISSGQGSTVKTLYMPACKKFRIILPPVKEQTEIVRRVEELFAFADTIEQKAAAALERVNNLTQSILAKAFRGELTADWRAANPELISGENSAEALLAKIQAEREKLALEKKAVKKTRKKKV